MDDDAPVPCVWALIGATAHIEMSSLKDLTVEACIASELFYLRQIRASLTHERNNMLPGRK